MVNPHPWALRPDSTSSNGRERAPGAPTLVLVHGALDRAESFGRVMRRLPEFAIVAYDRRGYQGSRGAGVVGLEGHISDLVEILASLRSGGAVSVSAVGHSLGGDVVIGAALADPELCESVGAFEPPMPWLGVDGAGRGRRGRTERWPAPDGRASGRRG